MGLDPAMRVVIDGSILCGPSAPIGVGRWLRGVLAGLPVSGNELEWTVAVPGLPGGLSDGMPVEVSPGDHPLGWRQGRLGGICEALGADLLYSPLPAFPVHGRCPRVTTVYELPWTGGGPRVGSRGLSKRLWTYYGSVAAERIVCASETTRERLVDYAFGAGTKARAVPAPLDPAFAEPVPEGVDEGRGAGLAGIDGSPYFLYVGTSEPKKNVVEVFRALQRFRDATPVSRDQRLVLVGPNDKARRMLLGEADRMGMRGLVSCLDGLSDAELRDVYRSADALLHLSWSEGLAWPVLEAQACGTPVVCSDRGALPETAGGAARVVPAGTDGAAACEALLRLKEDCDGRAELVRLGRERVQGLSREASAAAVTGIWREALGG